MPYKTVRNHFDNTLNYWTEFPEYKYLNGYRQLYNTDTSEDKISSSKIAWAIHYAYNPESKFFNIPDKLNIIKKDILKNNRFSWSSRFVKAAIESYKESVLTQAERSLISWNDTMVLRDEGLKSWYKDLFNLPIEDRDISIIANLDKQMANTAKFYADYIKIKDILSEEQVDKTSNKIESESDTDDF